MYQCTTTEELDVFQCKIEQVSYQLENQEKTLDLMMQIHRVDKFALKIMLRKIEFLIKGTPKQRANVRSPSPTFPDNYISENEMSAAKTDEIFRQRRKHVICSPDKQHHSKKSRNNHEFEINTSNRFLALSQDHYENQSNQDVEMKDIDNQQGILRHTAKIPSKINLRSFQNSQPGPATAKNSNNANKSRYVPPIYIDNPKNVPQLLDLLSEITKEKITGCIMNNDKLKIFPPTPEAHKTTQNKITQDDMKSHTYELNDEKQIKVDIRGPSKDFDTSEIISHLQNQGFAPTLCHRIRNRQSNTNFNLILVTLPKIPKSKEMHQIEFIGRMRVTIESLRKKQSPGQCYNCQEFFHHSRLCTRNPRCMKCAGPHRSRECPKPKDTTPKCLHCNCPHTANFTGCPKNPVNRTNFSEAPENAWADPTIFAKMKMPPTPAVETNPNPATQFNPRLVQLASNANPQPKKFSSNKCLK
ncbi:Nucleic-acid-binding protein from transposon X-element [Araneus ventricosus]|uniref:Nucleic-acid-binding protein from transposon X-element n=1 Tax=Araneus ventricosus TaxID=182803 RepID=A0A4Y2EHI5_ARAVE|nr:Nucleic-acid-binding protein from transposon X-element [Araneus ventricosus]